MKRKALDRSILFFLGLGLLLAWGCASTPASRFYTLNPLSGAETAGETQFLSQGPTLGLGPVRFPGYLERPGIVTRSGGNTIEIAEYDLWAGSLREDFLRVLSGNLAYLLKTDKIAIYPFTGTVPLDIRIILTLNRFEGTLGGEAVLEATWHILEAKGKKEGVIKRSRIVEAVAGSDYPSLVAAQSRSLEKLSREIAEAIRSQPGAAKK